MNSVVMNFLILVPVLSVCMVGILVSFWNMGTSKKAAILGALGFALIAGAHMFGAVMVLFVTNRSSANQAQMMFSIFRIAANLQQALGLVLLMIAAFSGRRTEA